MFKERIPYSRIILNVKNDYSLYIHILYALPYYYYYKYGILTYLHQSFSTYEILKYKHQQLFSYFLTDKKSSGVRSGDLAGHSNIVPLDMIVSHVQNGKVPILLAEKFRL